jgi:hypothetical protein
MKLFNAEYTHWYQADGEPMHTVLGTNGQERPTTVREARKLGLLPSVTNVLGVIAKPELVDWKMEQAVLAALTLPRGEGEGLDEFAKRVVADAQSRAQEAMDFGTALHGAAERIARGEEPGADGVAGPWIEPLKEWFRANCARVVWCERVVVERELGYAGKADLLMEHQAYGLTLVDFKTQGGRENAETLKAETLKGGGGGVWRPRVYKSWRYQLAAYRAALGRDVRCLNVIVNSNRPGVPVEHLWEEGEMLRGWRVFQAAHEVWCEEKGYDPGEKLKAETLKAEMGKAPVLVA